MVSLCALGFLSPFVPSPRAVQFLYSEITNHRDGRGGGRELPREHRAERAAIAHHSDSDAVLLLAPPEPARLACWRSARLSPQRGEARRSILVVTFTNHAAQQLKLNVAPKLANGGIDDVWTAPSTRSARGCPRARGPAGHEEELQGARRVGAGRAALDAHEAGGAPRPDVAERVGRPPPHTVLEGERPPP